MIKKNLSPSRMHSYKDHSSTHVGQREYAAVEDEFWVRRCDSFPATVDALRVVTGVVRWKHLEGLSGGNLLVVVATIRRPKSAPYYKRSSRQQQKG